VEAAQRGLTKRLIWLCHLRWLAAAGIIALTVAAVYGLDFPLPLSQLLLVGAVVLVYNVFLYAWARSAIDSSGVIPRPLAVWIAHLQIDLDLIALAWVIHLTGGVESPLGAYLIFHMIIASTLLTPQAAVAQATFASALYAGVVGLEAWGLIAHYPLGFLRAEVYTSPQVYLLVLVLVSVLYGSIYLAISIVQRLHQRERELSELTSRLQQEMQRTQEAYEQIQAAQQMQLHYMHRVSHELRRPIAAAVSLTKVILEGFSDEKPEAKTTQLLQRAVRRLQQGLDLVADLLVLSQAREAPLKEPCSWVDVARLIEEIADELADRAQQAQVDLKLDLTEALEPICTRPEGLRTVLTNLLGNALKYTEAGGQVMVGAVQEAQCTRISVADTGTGIRPEDQDHIFEEFFRTPQARDRDPEGTGLGLTIVQTIVSASGGQIQVESEPGEGTTFTVILPHRYPEMEPLAPAEGTTDHGAGQR